MINKKMIPYLRPFFCQHPTFIDVGANVGQSIELMKNFRPRAIHAFEPNPACFAILKEKYNQAQNIRLYNVGLGDSEGKGKDFYITQNTGDCSFVKPKYETNFNLRPLGEKPKIIHADIMKLDSIIALQSGLAIDWLKIDTQGFDLKVLRGAHSLLSSGRVKVVTAEIIFTDVYGKGFTFTEYEHCMHHYGYKTFTLSNINFCKDRRLSHCDITFIKE